MYLEVDFLGIVLILSFIIIFGIVEFISIKNKRRMMQHKAVKTPKRLDLSFEKDMVPLTTIIEHEYRQYFIYHIKPSFSMGNPLFSEEERLEIVTQLLGQVKNNLSKEYINHMTFHYFSEDGLNNLITDLLYNKLNEAVASHNFKKVGKVIGSTQ